MKKLTLLIVLLFSLGLLTGSKRIKKNSHHSLHPKHAMKDEPPSNEESPAQPNDEACLEDADCHRNLFFVDSEGCTRTKECGDDGNCQVYIACPAADFQGSSEEVDDKTCLDDPNCHRSVTYCYFEGCCASKECPPGGECSVAMPGCANVHDKPELNDQECFDDNDCYRNVTICYFEGCCSYKTCSEGYCAVAMSMCIAPSQETLEPELAAEESVSGEEPSGSLSDKACFYDENCHRNVSVIDSDGCRNTQECDNEGNCEVYQTCPMIVIDSQESFSYEEPPVEEFWPEPILMSDEECLLDPECKVSVTYCWSENCCGAKECKNGECAVIIPECRHHPEECAVPSSSDHSDDKPPSDEQPSANPDDEACFYDENCRRNVFVVDSDGCTRTKQCDDDGNCEVYMACPAFEDSQGSSEEVDPKTCLEDSNCRRNVNYCYFEGCCASKECDGGECSVAMPLCATVHDKPELNDDDCFWDNECYRNITSCYFEGCCSHKTCSEGYCAIAMPMCVAPSEEEVSAPELAPSGGEPSANLDDAACFYDENCRRNVFVVDSEGCTRTKECDDDGNCEVYMACPAVADSESSSEEVDDKTCLDDPNCHRNVNFCYFEGCCASKDCDGGDCSVTMPVCATVHDKPELNDDDCFWDNECYRNITSCDPSGRCCGEKLCTEGYCSVAIPICEAQVEMVYESEEVPMNEEETEQCLLDPECKVSLTYCWSENCCGGKECDENGKCVVVIPECRNHPEECAVHPRNEPSDLIQLNKADDESVPVLAHNNHGKRSGLSSKLKANKGQDI